MKLVFQQKMLGLLVLGSLFLAFAKISHAQSVIDIQPNGNNRRFNLSVVRNTIATLDKMMPSTVVRCNNPLITGLNREVKEGEDVENLVFMSATYLKDNLSTLQPQWIVDTNQVVIGAVLEVKNKYSYEFIEADPDTEEVLQYLDQPGADVLMGADFTSTKLTATNLRPYSPAGAVSVVGYKLANGAALHALKGKSPKEYEKLLAQSKNDYKGKYEQLDALKAKRAVERTTRALNRFLMKGDYVAVETFVGEKVKKINVSSSDPASMPAYMYGYILDEYNELRYPADLGLYSKAKKHVVPGQVTYLRWSTSKQAAQLVEEELGDGRPIYLSSNCSSAIENLSTGVEDKISIRFSAPHSSKHASEIAAQLAATAKVGLLLDWMDWSSYRKYTNSGSSSEKIGAAYLIYAEGGQYGVTDIESDRKLGLTENISATPSELFELLSDRIDLGERTLRIASEKKGKVKSFLYYQPVGAIKETGEFVSIYVERFETVDGKKISRFESIGTAVAKGNKSKSCIRIVNVRKGEEEVGAAFANGEKLIIRKMGFKFLGKKYK